MEQKLRALVLVTTPKMRELVVKLFEESETPMHYAANGMGTAPSEIMDILGLGSTEKCITVAKFYFASYTKIASATFATTLVSTAKTLPISLPGRRHSTTDCPFKRHTSPT